MNTSAQWTEGNIAGATSCNFEYELYYIEVDLEDDTDLEDLTNLCELDENEAQLIAEDFLMKVGIDDMVCTDFDKVRLGC